MSKIVETVTAKSATPDVHTKFTILCRDCDRCSASYQWLENALQHARSHARILDHTVDITDEEASE